MLGYQNNLTVTFSLPGVDRIRETNLNGEITSEVKHLAVDDGLSVGDFVTTGAQSYCELSGEFRTIRLGSETIIKYKKDDHWKLIDGSILFCLLDKKPVTVTSEKGESIITGPCTIILETTSNGGYKAISLSGKPSIEVNERKVTIPSGRLVLVLGESKMLGDGYDIDLLLLLRSSQLINAFETPPPTMKRIGLAVYAQQKKLKGKFNLLIGDAPTDKNLQMWVLGSSQNKKAE